MMRALVIRQVGLFNESMIAEKEPELCARIHRAGGKILRIDAEMTWHDAAMTRFAQWWRRSLRNGHAYAEGVALRGWSRKCHWLRPMLSQWAWGVLLPFISVALAGPTAGWSLRALGTYPVQATRIVANRLRRGDSTRDALVDAAFVHLVRIPGVIGQLTYRRRRLLGQPSTLIEHKGDNGGVR